jgi:cytochrome c biogenesis protein CcmG/thiol:disulfide interchange protein DsbE
LVAVVAVAVAAAFLALLLRPSGVAAPRLEPERFNLIAAGKRKSLPDAVAPTLTPPPKSISLVSLRGRPTFLGVWASWCVPCREEAPLLARLWRQYRSEVRFVGIDVEDSRAAARAFVRRYRLGYPHIFDAKARLATKLGFLGLPTAYFVDADGRVAAKLIGKQEEATLRAAFAALAREAKSAQ